MASRPASARPPARNRVATYADMRGDTMNTNTTNKTTRTRKPKADPIVETPIATATEVLTDTDGTTIQTYERANKLTVKTLDDGVMQADFYRTHKHIATIRSTETGFVPNEDAETKTAIREEFRKFMMDHAADIGVNYDPADRRTESNVRKSTYKSTEDVVEDAIAMVSGDIDTFISKMPHAELVQGYEIGIESLTPKTSTSKGSNLAMMGIEDGKYVSNGNLAWFDIDGVVTIQIKADNTETEIYQPIKMELVSGQLKKFRMTQTQWNTETTNSLTEAGVIKNKEGEEG